MNKPLLALAGACVFAACADTSSYIYQPTEQVTASTEGVPASLQSAKRLPEFDFFWNVHATARVVAERTPFERTRLEPQYAYDYGSPSVGINAAWGPVWWYDPLFPSATFVHPVRVYAPHRA